MKQIFRSIKNVLSRFNWQEARQVELETAINLAGTVFFYSFALISFVCLFFGIWWQIILGAPSYVLGAVLLNDTQWGNESALHYVQRIFGYVSK